MWDPPSFTSTAPRGREQKINAGEEGARRTGGRFDAGRGRMEPHRSMGEPKANGATAPLPQRPPHEGPRWRWGIPDGDRTRRGNPSSDWEPHSPSEHPGTAQGPQAMGPPQCLPLLPSSPLRKRRRHLLNGAGRVGLGREPISCGGAWPPQRHQWGWGGTAQPFGQSASGGVATHLPYLPLTPPLFMAPIRARGSRDGDMGTGTWGQGYGDGDLVKGPWGWGQGWGPGDRDPGEGTPGTGTPALCGPQQGARCPPRG